MKDFGERRAEVHARECRPCPGGGQTGRRVSGCYHPPVAQHLHHVFSFAEYLSIEQDSAVRHEYLDGTAWAMAGGSPAHAALAINVATLLNLALRAGPCRVYSSDLRVRIRETGSLRTPT
jgi:Uma2 family endonuclease